VPPGRWSARHVPTRTSQDGAGPSACKSARPAGTAPAGNENGPGRQARPGVSPTSAARLPPRAPAQGKPPVIHVRPLGVKQKEDVLPGWFAGVLR
jgi:hypothetical protein